MLPQIEKFGLKVEQLSDKHFLVELDPEQGVYGIFRRESVTGPALYVPPVRDREEAIKHVMAELANEH